MATVVSIEPPRGQPQRRPWSTLAFFAVLALGCAAWVWFSDAPRRALAQMPPAERAAVYARERANFEAMCNPPAKTFRGQCEKRAAFLRDFPECDASCRDLVRELLR